MSIMSRLRQAITDILRLSSIMISGFNSMERRLIRIERALALVLREEDLSRERDINMSTGLDRVKEEIAQNKDAVASATTLLASLSERIRNSASDETALRALADELDAQNSDLAKAVTENTPFSPSGNN